jgi:glycosidase
MLLLTLRGTPTVYNGDELGMTMARIPPDRVLDPFEINVPGLGLGRDGARSPMAWSDGVYAGFSQSEPWCPLIEDWAITNVANLDKNPAAEFFVTVAVATTFFIELGMAHVEHIAALIIGGLLAAPFGGYIVRHVPPHVLMASVGVLVSALALFQLVKSIG